MWLEHGYFGHDTCSIQLEKENMPENSLFYLNNCLLSYKGSKSFLRRSYFILSQILE